MRIICHLDMDAFFAAIEERDNPQWRGFPIVVGADPSSPAGEGKGRGVVSTANYEARKFGIHSAMPISRAWRLAQEGKKLSGKETIFLPGNMKRYGQVSTAIMAIIENVLMLQKHLPIYKHIYGYKYKQGGIEQVSVDEAYMDLSFAVPLEVASPRSSRLAQNARARLLTGFKKAEAICRKIKREIKKREKLTASIGLAPNKLIAKIASDMQKPDGLTIVLPGEEQNFLRPLVLRKIPGIGPKTQMQLEEHGMFTVSDALQLTEADLYDMLGEWGLELYEKLRGRSESPVTTEPEEAKSVGEQVTFDEDTLSPQLIADSLELMARSIINSLAKDGFISYRRVVLTVRFADFKTVTRSHTIGKPERRAEILYREALKMLLPFFDKRENPDKKKIRLVGIRVEQLV